MKGFFKKTYRPNTNESRPEKDRIRPAVTVERISDFSHKSPKLVGDAFPLSSMSTPFSDFPLPEPPDPTIKPGAYLRSIYAVRERTKLVLEEAKVNALSHFDVDLSKFQDTADYVVSIIKVNRSNVIISWIKINTI
jgi:hypothetical protein